MNQHRCREIFARLQAENPSPKTELRYETPFQLLIAVILSAQATDVSVNKVTGPLFKVAPDARAMLVLGEKRLKEHIKTIGLFNAKATHILKTCAILCDHHEGRVPDNRSALMMLPGVGRKTANVLLNTLFGQPTVAVDTHVFRVANRIPLAEGKTVHEVERTLVRRIPAEYLLHAHHWLVLHGRHVCVARKPRCARCVIADICEYPEKNL